MSDPSSDVPQSPLYNGPSVVTEADTARFDKTKQDILQDGSVDRTVGAGGTTHTATPGHTVTGDVSTSPGPASVMELSVMELGDSATLEALAVGREELTIGEFSNTAVNEYAITSGMGLVAESQDPVTNMDIGASAPVVTGSSINITSIDELTADPTPRADPEPEVLTTSVSTPQESTMIDEAPTAMEQGLDRVKHLRSQLPRLATDTGHELPSIPHQFGCDKTPIGHTTSGKLTEEAPTTGDTSPRLAKVPAAQLLVGGKILPNALDEERFGSSQAAFAAAVQPMPMDAVLEEASVSTTLPPAHAEAFLPASARESSIYTSTEAAAAVMAATVQQMPFSTPSSLPSAPAENLPTTHFDVIHNVSLPIADNIQRLSVVIPHQLHPEGFQVYSGEAESYADLDSGIGSAAGIPKAQEVMVKTSEELSCSSGEANMRPIARQKSKNRARKAKATPRRSMRVKETREHVWTSRYGRRVATLSGM